MLCQEAHYDCDVVDAQDDLTGYRLVILPDVCVMTPELADTLRAYVEEGGCLLLSHTSGCDAEGNFLLDFLPVRYEGPEPLHPTFWRCEPGLTAELRDGDRVLYSQGSRYRATGNARVRIDRVLPYFQRTDETFSSHFQTPPKADADSFPALITAERVAVFADPIFRDLRQNGTPSIPPAWSAVMRELIGPPPFGDGLSKRIEVYPMRKGDDLLLTLLHYVPVRKSVEIDVIDEPSTFAGQTLRFAKAVPEVSLVEADKEIVLGSQTDAVDLPHQSGRIRLRVKDYSSSP